MLPLCGLRVGNLQLLKGTFLNMPEQSRTTLQQLERRGVLDSLVLPRRHGCIQCKTSRSVPYFLREMIVAGMYFCPDAESKKTKKAGGTVIMASVENGLFHPKKDPAFENICGSVYLSCMAPYDSLPPPADPTIFVRGRKKRGRVSGKWFASGDGHEIFTVHGNLVLKKGRYGTTVNFKGFKDCSLLLKLLGHLFPRRLPYRHAHAHTHIHTCLNESEQVPTTLAAASLDALHTQHSPPVAPDFSQSAAVFNAPVCTHKHLHTRTACKESARVPA